MTETDNPDLTLTAETDAPMTAEQAALLKRLSHDAYDIEALEVERKAKPPVAPAPGGV